MKRTLFTVMIALAVLTGAYSIAGAADGVHINYRAGGYSGACSAGTAACHSISPVTFMPQALDSAAAPNPEDYANFCLTCHNAAGEAHNKSVGTPSNNVYKGSTTTLGNSGVSHSWKGLNHNAGTRTPTAPDFAIEKYGIITDGTMFMPGGKVNCQTCHDSMTKRPNVEKIENWAAGSTLNNLDYTFGYTSTKQYLAQYIRVYRYTGSVIGTRPTNVRVKELAALGIEVVDPSEYSYNYQNATITFKTSQAGKNINVEILQPYLRVDNTANAMCLDCHADRISIGVSHAPGTGVKNGHPAKVNYGHTLGLQNTLKPSGTGNTYFENVSGYQKVLCTTCHDPHNAASNNGQLMREANDQTLCGDCHKTRLDGYSTAGSVNIHNGSKHLAGPTVCVDCHTTHNSNNIMLIKNVINGKTINFQNFSNANSFGNDTGSGICEACHAVTDYHKSNGSGTGHNTGKNCLGCHKHENGFAGGGCTGCHGMPPAVGSVPSGWSGDGDKHTGHMAHILTKFGLSGQNACACCHGSKPGSPHPENLDYAYIDTSSPIYWNGGTFSYGLIANKTNTADDTCNNVKCHGQPSGQRTWGGSSGCDGCHNYPVAGSNWPAGNPHSVQRDGVTNVHLPATGYDAANDDYVTMVNNPTKCGKCHVFDPNHMSTSTVTLQGNGNAACGGGNFIITQTTPGSVVTCSNVRCHIANKTTPNWY